MNKGLTLSFSKQSTKQDLDQSTIQENSPILLFLEKQKKRNIFYISFKVVAVQVQLNHAYYLIEVNEYGKKWVMRIRYSQLQQLNKNLCKLYRIKLTLSSNFVFNRLRPEYLKKRAIKIQSFLNEIGVQISKIQIKEFYDSEFFPLLIVFIRVKMPGKDPDRLHRRRDPLIRMMSSYNQIKKYSLYYELSLFQYVFLLQERQSIKYLLS
ncbi:unnamed protein product (macronuclear) [Paramecium tetraurelia]|uniref:PX domain-containing protein n=1 Tax=Paramecium tetraurelia TaxID=5888 RepID=A0DKA4_PARTE|nr:uncharacterized protein GSPATT00017800001 [Paramecium tetraurelia]CAK83471.1 unnamed protein product [Paramecium tetraurelia]|eukprot:XP_001450868.1 hypothetical protein (macronuclear) [Paramecium tetraurelia strain d4-2]